MIVKTRRNVLLLAMLTAGAIEITQAGQALKICDDEGGWPPYTFVDPKNPEAITGASVEVIVTILKRAGYEPQITLLPWKRCLAEVEAGTTQMLLNASYSDERAQKFLMSKPYYSVRTELFYLTSKYPTPPKIATVADMKKYRHCGMFGYNYTMYELPESQLDSGAKDEPSRMKKLRLDRCDFILGDVEILKSFSAMGQLDISGTSSIPIPGAKPKDFHAMVSKASPEGEKLLKIINDGITTLQKDKTYAKILKKYGI